MALFVVSDLITVASGYVVYLIQNGSGEDTHPQEVRILTDENGDYLRDAEIVALSGDPLRMGTEGMIAKLLHLRTERGEWPRRASLQC